MREYPIRITMSCMGREEMGVEVGAAWGEEVGVVADKVVTVDRVEVDDMELVRDGDHLVFLRDGGGDLGPVGWMCG